jgi:hypothetical protein
MTILVFDLFFVKFEFRDHYGDVGHHLLVQDAPSFIEKFMMSMQFWSQVVFVYISKKCSFLLISMFWPFPGLLAPISFPVSLPWGGTHSLTPHMLPNKDVQTCVLERKVREVICRPHGKPCGLVLASPCPSDMTHQQMIL